MVSGGSRGLGKEIATALAQAGANLVLGARTPAALKQAAAEIAAATGRQVLPLELNVTARESVESAVKACMERFGRIDVLVNSAGINVRAPVAGIRDEDWHDVQQTNVTGTFHCCRAVIPHMVSARYGRIINIGSGLSLVGLNERVNYCTSKAAVVGMTKALAVELATTGVTVNCLCPGPFATEINRPLLANPAAASFLLAQVPMGRWAQMSEIRTSALFLASPHSSYVTGAILTCDGGWTAR